jgi:hypothetical protein
MGVEPMTAATGVPIDRRIGRKVTWQVYGLRFVGTVRSAFNDPFDGEEFLSVDVESVNDGPNLYPGVPASIFPPDTPCKGNAQWVD